MTFVLFRFLYGPRCRLVLSPLKTLEQCAIFALFILVNIEPNPFGEFLGDKRGKGQKIIDVIVFFIIAAAALYIDTLVGGHVQLALIAEYFDYCLISWLCHW